MSLQTPADYRISVDLPAEAVAEPVPAQREPVRFALRISLSGRERESGLIDVGVLTLPANAVAGAAASQPDASTLRRADSPDSQAQALAERAHAGIAAIDRLPRLYYRLDQGGGDVDGMDDPDACTLERLIEALDGQVFKESSRTRTLAWSGTQAFWTNTGAPIHEDGMLRPPHCTVWTAKEAWHRSLGGDEPRINLFSDHRHLAGDLANIGYFRRVQALRADRFPRLSRNRAGCLGPLSRGPHVRSSGGGRRRQQAQIRSVLGRRAGIAADSQPGGVMILDSTRSVVTICTRK